MSAISVDVVVPVYGNWDLTAQCLAALRLQTYPHRVVLVDDASLDDTVKNTAALFPEVDIVAVTTNSGFAHACNRGIAAGKSDVVILVNNDVIASERMIEELAAVFADQTVGSGVPLLTRPDGAVDAFGITSDSTLAGFLRFNGAEVSAVNEDSPKIVGPYGAVAAYRRSALESVGGLDESLFMYGEELDLAFRLQAAGWTVACASASRGVHLGGATAGRGSPKQRFLSGYGRGFILRTYGVVLSRYGVRAIATEAIVCGIQLIRWRDLSGIRGRLSGWRDAKSGGKRKAPTAGIDRSISFVESLRMRSGHFWQAGAGRFGASIDR